MLEALLPPVCIACARLLDRADTPLCRGCHARTHTLHGADRRSDEVEALYAYDGPIVGAVASFKFAGRIELAPALGFLLARAPILDEPFDLVVPVPLHFFRRFVRGFDQSLLLAHAMADTRSRAGRPFPLIDARALVRQRATAPQRALDGERRRENLRGAFRAVRSRVEGLRILVIDDVTTTGATIDECRASLFDAGAHRVAGLALLRRLPG